jgi:hypothetical protein
MCGRVRLCSDVGEIELVFLIEPVAIWLSETALQRARAMMFCCTSIENARNVS